MTEPSNVIVPAPLFCTVPSPVMAPATVVLLLTVKVRALALDATKGCCC